MNTKKIAITGGIGSGKSTVLTLLKEKGFEVFSCDEIYKEISLDIDYIRQLEGVFPQAVINGAIDRKKLAKIVFQDDSLRTQLNNIAHPLIMRKLLERMSQAKGRLVFAEVPLLFEGNFETLFDDIIVVKRSLHDRIDAVMKRDQLEEKQIKSRSAAQFDYDSEEGEQRIRKCNAYILINNGSLAALDFELQNLLSILNKS